jgi:D-serine deaminase-like pyridoxal phosphate-dependent protein
MSDQRVGGAKSMPPDAAGLGIRDFISRGATLADLWTPLLVLDDERLSHNIRWMAEWVAAHGVELMPHGKTTMAPAIWRRQLDAGATGITVATPWQLRVAREAGVSAVMLANQLADRHAITWVAADLEARGGRVWSWVDHPDAVAIAEDALAGTGAVLDVLVELGRPGGRTGVRTADAAVALAERVAASPALRLAGVAGYEGAVAHGRSPDADAIVRDFVDDLVGLHDRVATLCGVDDPIVTAGGSAYPDLVAERLSAAAGSARLVLRSGAYVTHDDGYYRAVSPFESGSRAGGGLLAAARGIARVVSAPEPGLVLVDAGKRDFPYDEGLPVPLFGVTRDGRRLDLAGAETTKLNDQHGFVRGVATTGLGVGDLVVFGLSHPCTMFDKWRLVPVVSSLDDPASAVVVDLVETRF